MSSSNKPTPPIPPELDGYLLKMKHHHSIFGIWNTRYFRVNKENACIEYFGSKEESQSDNAHPRGLNYNKIFLRYLVQFVVLIIFSDLRF